MLFNFLGKGSNVDRLQTIFILPKIFGNSRRIMILEILLKNYKYNENAWINFSEIARQGKISISTVKRIIESLIQNDLAKMRENTYQTPVKNPERQVKLNYSSKISRELIFFYQKLLGII